MRSLKTITTNLHQLEAGSGILWQAAEIAHNVHYWGSFLLEDPAVTVMTVSALHASPLALLLLASVCVAFHKYSRHSFTRVGLSIEGSASQQASIAAPSFSITSAAITEFVVRERFSPRENGLFAVDREYRVLFRDGGEPRSLHESDLEPMFGGSTIEVAPCIDITPNPAAAGQLAA